MLCTPDMEIVGLNGGRYSGKAMLSVETTPSVHAYISEADESGLSTRSKLARCGSFFTPRDSPVWRGDALEVDAEYRNLGPPIVYAHGDRVARAYALREAERIAGQELSDISQGFGSISADGRSILVDILDDKLRIGENARMPARKILNGQAVVQTSGKRRWDRLEDFTLLLTAGVAVPRGVYGLIRGTTWGGDTHHIASTVVDPGWEGSLVLELGSGGDPASVEERPKLILDLYHVTDA